MAQLLIRITDKNHPTFEGDIQQMKRGDVIMVVEDSYVFAAQELNFPDWRILKFPDVTVAEASVLISREIPEVIPADPNDAVFKSMQARGYKLDLGHPAIPSNMISYLNDNTRAVAIFQVPKNVSFNSLVTKKAKRTKPTK